jgi:hypothetical protein
VVIKNHEGSFHEEMEYKPREVGGQNLGEGRSDNYCKEFLSSQEDKYANMKT